MGEKTKTARSLSGRVISNKMNKTITVQVDRRIRHPLYGKIVTRHTKLHAHDESNECQEGDRCRSRNAGRCPSPRPGVW